MDFDKKFLKDYILESNDNKYILNLYRVYELCSKITGGRVLKHKKELIELEDEIFTVNGKVIPQSNRILYEIKRIINIPLDKKPILLKERDELLKDIVDADLSDVQEQKIIKNRIVVLQAKIDLPIDFLYNACLSFYNIYSSAYINKKLLNNYDDLKIKNIEINDLYDFDFSNTTLKKAYDNNYNINNDIKNINDNNINNDIKIKEVK